MADERPKAFSYLDHRAFLRDWFAWKKRQNPLYSFRLASRLMKTRDPSALKNIIDGRRRVSEERIEVLVRLVAMEPAEGDYFRWLVAFGQATSESARSHALAELATRLSERRVPEIDDTRGEYVSTWLDPAVRELVLLNDYREDPQWMADQLVPEVDADDVRDAIARLVRLGLLRRREDGRLVQSEATVKTGETSENAVGAGYHRDMHALAGSAMEAAGDASSGEWERTAFLGATLAVPHSKLADLRNLLWRTQLQALQLAEEHQDDADHIVQINFHLFPIAPRRDEAGE